MNARKTIRQTLAIGMAMALFMVGCAGQSANKRAGDASETDAVANAQQAIDGANRNQVIANLDKQEETTAAETTTPESTTAATTEEKTAIDIEAERIDVAATQNRLKMDKGVFSQKDVKNGVIAYMNGSAIAAITAVKGVDGIPYAMEFHYENDLLFFAKLESVALAEFYYNLYGIPVRLRYAEDASAPQSATNFDNVELDDWSFVEDEGYKLLALTKQPTTTTTQPETTTVPPVTTTTSVIQTQAKDDSLPQGADAYILPDVLNRAYSITELSGMSIRKLGYARNELYARFGYPFNKTEYQQYFGSKNWYTRNNNLSMSDVSAMIKSNTYMKQTLANIQSLEPQ